MIVLVKDASDSDGNKDDQSTRQETTIVMLTGIHLLHYSDFIMSAMASKLPASLLFTQPFIQAEIKENIKAPRHWPLCREFTGDRWIPRTMGQ